MAEAWLVDPEYFSGYAGTVHGLSLGMVCFFSGFTSICTQDSFWLATERIRWVALVVALSLCLVRLFIFQPNEMPNWLIAFESMSWMLTVLGIGSLYLNKPSAALSYFSASVYPVYIVHMPVQFLIAYFLFPCGLPAIVNLFLLLAGTFGVSLLLYEYIVRRIKWIRPLFGLKLA